MKLQRLMSHIRSALEQYNMIEDGDRIAVGLSGGKDSVAMLAALAEMRRFYPKKYELVAITLDYRFHNQDGDFSQLEEMCRRLGVKYVVKRTELYNIIFEVRKEKNPCSLCARMRRGLLHDTAKEYGCNKIALGHHLDDAVETFMMNLLNGGTISCFSPITYLSRKDIYSIRPMVLTPERVVLSAVKNANLPIVKSKCPADGETERERIKQFIWNLERNEGYDGLRDKIIGALQRKNIDGWGIDR